MERAGLDDKIEMKGLEADIVVSQVMDTEGKAKDEGSGLLCYRY